MIAGQKVTGKQLETLKRVLDDMEQRLLSGWFEPDPSTYIETVGHRSVSLLLREPFYPVSDRNDPPEGMKCVACALGGLLLGALGTARDALPPPHAEKVLYRSHLGDQALVLACLRETTGLDGTMLRLIERAFCAEYGRLFSSFVGTDVLNESVPWAQIREADRWFYEEESDDREETEFNHHDRMKVIIQALREGEGTVNFDENPHNLLARWNQAHAAKP